MCAEDVVSGFQTWMFRAFAAIVLRARDAKYTCVHPAVKKWLLSQ